MNLLINSALLLICDGRLKEEFSKSEIRNKDIRCKYLCLFSQIDTLFSEIYGHMPSKTWENKITFCYISFYFPMEYASIVYKICFVYFHKKKFIYANGIEYFV